MLKNTVDSIDDIEEKYQGFYTEEDGIFKLDENLRQDDNTALLNAKNHERDARKKAERENKDLKEQQEAAAIALAEAKGDKEELERLQQKKLDGQRKELQKEAITWKEKYLNETVGKLKSSIATEVYIDPDRLNLKHIESRVKLIDDQPQVVDEFGAVMDRNEFIKELKEDPNMASYIKAGKASGGGTSGNKPTVAGNKPYSELSMDEKKALFKNKKKFG